jgi:hypothetical protein
VCTNLQYNRLLKGLKEQKNKAEMHFTNQLDLIREADKASQLRARFNSTTSLPRFFLQL